ncbi:B3 domain-containing protein REM9-like [Papaver somniferum]|uniref:B3 domain-containing protein REM9-like n=1 Tax=Papaver somniferum TaxID=3469 RepID=UPI000E6FE0F2|nr:B3 domain-containing protein REM9-like [Papaver somniferum]
MNTGNSVFNYTSTFYRQYKFAREHLAAEVTNPYGVAVLLQNEEGLSWEVLVKPAGRKYTFGAGWKHFSTDNKLKIGDCVIFELIDRLPDSTFAMNFHICRIPVPVPSPFPAQERKRCGKACENSTIRKDWLHSPHRNTRLIIIYVFQFPEKFASAIAFESKVNSFSSPFHFFRTSMKPSSVLRMYIPVKFAREHLPTKCGEERMDHVLLQNVEGRSWELRASLSGCENYYLHRGWKKFATDNKLNIGDCLLFELIGRLPDATFVMIFRISRIPVFVDDDLDDE